MDAIYPKALLRNRITPKSKQCFVLMPFKSEFDEIYAEIKNGLHEITFSALRADDMDQNRPIITNIISEIAASHFVIADLTSKNPNVFYEVGIAHSIRDLANVILLSQSIEDVPFDLRHLPVIIYAANNLRGLRVRLTKRILENRHIFEGQMMIRQRYASHLDARTLEELIEYLGLRDPFIWNLISHSSQHAAEALPAGEIGRGVYLLRDEMSGLAGIGNTALLHAFFHLVSDFLRRNAAHTEVREFVLRAFETNRLVPSALSDSDGGRLMVQLSEALFRTDEFKSAALQWIVNYLARPKIAGVDLLRSRIEHFIMTVNDPEMNQTLLLMLRNTNSSIRETAADLLGEMRVDYALGNLISTLSRETNPYVARSIFSALGKLGVEAGAEPIISWIQRNWDNVQSRAWDFILYHAGVALEMIDQANRSFHRSELDRFRL
jgi:hypothetical protein